MAVLTRVGWLAARLGGSSLPRTARASSGDLSAWLVGLLTWHPKT